jgi:hypothetical protein
MLKYLIEITSIGRNGHNIFSIDSTVKNWQSRHSIEINERIRPKMVKTPKDDDDEYS